MKMLELLCLLISMICFSSNAYSASSNHDDMVFHNMNDFLDNINKSKSPPVQYSEEEIEKLESKTKELFQLIDDFMKEQLLQKENKENIPNYKDYDNEICPDK
jgi:hypothetical protein